MKNGGAGGPHSPHSVMFFQSKRLLKFWKAVACWFGVPTLLSVMAADVPLREPSTGNTHTWDHHDYHHNFSKTASVCYRPLVRRRLWYHWSYGMAASYHLGACCVSNVPRGYMSDFGGKSEIGMEAVGTHGSPAQLNVLLAELFEFVMTILFRLYYDYSTVFRQTFVLRRLLSRTFRVHSLD